MHALLSDLAMILIVAGVTTLVFKKLKQPLVLGYIIAGFLTGPNFSYFPTITDKVNVEAWSEIGVIFLMFALGLEFSFYKLKKVGSTAFIAASVAMFGMIITGYICATLMGWNRMDSIFLGGMLSMSSTMIIIKAFDDFNLKEKKFAGVVIGTLIIEDIAGVVMMVLISTIAAASANVSPLELGMGIGKLVFCIILWFVLGMFLIPTIFKRYSNLFNDETFVVVSIGLCLSMVVIAESAGLSAALGAFIMGSLIAEAPQAEHIEHLVKPIKDLFAAIFFVSVGMLVNPALLLQYAGPIALLVLVTVTGQPFFAALGVLAAGQPLKTAVRSGLSLCQIGEFSFIIASLGASLGITSEFIYPIIVAVSVITTFTTPFFISSSEAAAETLKNILPPKILNYLERHTNEDSAGKDNEWVELLKAYTLHMLIISVLLTAVALAAKLYALPYLSDTLHLPYANYIGAAATLFVMAPILRVTLQNTAGNAKYFSSLWFKRRANHIPLLALILGKVFVATIAIYFIFRSLAGWHGLLALAGTLAVTYLISSSKWLLSQYLRLESRFLVNLNEKHVREHWTDENAVTTSWFDEQLYLVSYKISPTSPMVGKSLIELKFRQEYHCEIIGIKASDYEFMPGGNATIPAGAEIILLGKEQDLNIFAAAINQRHLEARMLMPPTSLRSYMLSEDIAEEDQLFTYALPINAQSPLAGKAIRNTDIRDTWNCIIVGLERGSYNIINPNVSMMIETNDLLWVLGAPASIQELMEEFCE